MQGNIFHKPQKSLKKPTVLVTTIIFHTIHVSNACDRSMKNIQYQKGKSLPHLIVERKKCRYTTLKSEGIFLI